jgi:hypothetical protein
MYKASAILNSKALQPLKINPNHMSSPRIIPLTPPSVSEAHIQEKIVCIRAHRERMFNISTQVEYGKLICHNFGQGGAGWTFLFGCVNESIRQFEQQLAQNPHLKDKPICVVGAGCYGLLTAINLIRKGCTVHIIAKEARDIPSYKAAGFFFPRPRRTSGPYEHHVFKTLGMESYQAYLSIAHGTHPFIHDASQLLPAYYDPEIDPGYAPYIQTGLMVAPQEVIIDFGNGKRYRAQEYKTIFINPAAIMHNLERERMRLGIQVIQQEIHSFEALPEEIIFNCAGLGAMKLVTADTMRIVPVQGHLITLKNQPAMSQLQYMINARAVVPMENGKTRNDLIYYAPKDQGILGITFLRGEESLTANQHEFDRLIQRCQNYFGSV